MKFKVGDKVKVRKDLILGETYGKDMFISDMVGFEGETLTVQKVCDNCYWVAENSWNWTDEMLEDADEVQSLQEKIAALELELSTLKQTMNIDANTRFRAKEDDYYYAVYGGISEEFSETDELFDDFNYKTRNYFKTEQEAEDYLDKINTYYELMDLAEELNKDNIKWSDTNQHKFYIIYGFYEEQLELADTRGFSNTGVIYCLDENFLEKAKERIGEERLIKLFKGDNNE